MLIQCFNALRRRRRERLALEALSLLSDRQLNDLGLVRNAIQVHLRERPAS